MGDNWTRHELVEGLTRLRGENPVRQEQFDPDSLFFDELNPQETGVRQEPPSQPDNVLDFSPLGYEHGQLQAAFDSTHDPTYPEQNAFLLTEPDNSLSLRDVTVLPSTVAGEERPTRTSQDYVQESESNLHALNGGQIRPPSIQTAINMQQPLDYTSLPSNLGFHFSPWGDLLEQNNNQVCAGNMGTLQIPNANYVQPLPIQTTLNVQRPLPTVDFPPQASSLPAQWNGWSERDNAQADSRNESTVGELNGLHMQTPVQRVSNEHQFSEMAHIGQIYPTSHAGDFQTNSRETNPEPGQNLQAGSENQHESQGRTDRDSLPQKKTASLRDEEETESNGSFKVSFSVSDDGSEGDRAEPFQLRPPNQASQSEVARETPAASDTQQCRRMTNEIQGTRDIHSRQQSRRSNVSKSPGSTASEARQAVGQGARTRSVRIVTPPRITPEREDRRSISERRPTPTASRARQRDIRDRRFHAQEVENVPLEKEKQPENETEGIKPLTEEYVRSLDFRYKPLPDIERELYLKEEKGYTIPAIEIKLQQEHLVSPIIRYIRDHPRTYRHVRAPNGNQVVLVPDDELFGVLYRLVKNLMLHRLEGKIASFVSHILNKSINNKIPGYFCRKFIMFVEKLSVPNKLKDVHNYIFKGKNHVDITWILQKLERHLDRRLCLRAPTYMTAVFLTRLEQHRRESEFVKKWSKDVRAWGTKSLRKSVILKQNHVMYEKGTVPNQMGELERRQADFQMVIEQFTHEFCWYSREMFLCEDIQSHYILARFMMRSIIQKKRTKLKHEVGEFGNQSRLNFWVNIEEYINALWKVMVDELYDFLQFADPAVFMVELCKELDTRCKKILLDVKTDMNPRKSKPKPKAVYFPHYGNQIGSFCAKSFGKAEAVLTFQKTRLSSKRQNLESLEEAYDLFHQSTR